MEEHQKMDVFGVRYKVKGPQKDYTYADAMILSDMFVLTSITGATRHTSARSQPNCSPGDRSHCDGSPRVTAWRS